MLLTKSARMQWIFANFLQFLLIVWKAFRQNQIMLLASALAFNGLLSIVPLIALLLIIASNFVEQTLLVSLVEQYVSLIAPRQTDVIVAQILGFFAHWKAVGILGLFGLMFFVSLVFSVLEKAMHIIFAHRHHGHPRKVWVSMLIPVSYMVAMILSIVIISVTIELLRYLNGLASLGWSMDVLQTSLIYLLGLLGELVLFTSLYRVMPVGRTHFRYALIGGLLVTLCWEVLRRIMVWYLSTLSIVNVVFGAFATVIILLLLLEAVAVIVLLGAQLIACYEQLELPPHSSPESD